MPSVKAKLRDPLQGRPIPATGVVGWRKLAPLLKKLASGIGLEVSVEGGNVQTIDGGVHIKVAPTDNEGLSPVELDVCFGGAPAKRMIQCSRAYHYVSGEKVYLE